MHRLYKIFFFIILSVGLGYSCGQKQADKKTEPSINMADFDAESDIRKNDIHLISYGLRLPAPRKDSLTKKYGFYYQDRGCLYTDSMNLLGDIYNKRIIEYLSKQNGKNWYKQFQKIEDSLDNEMMKHFSNTVK